MSAFIAMSSTFPSPFSTDACSDDTEQTKREKSLFALHQFLLIKEKGEWKWPYSIVGVGVFDRGSGAFDRGRIRLESVLKIVSFKINLTKVIVFRLRSSVKALGI